MTYFLHKTSQTIYDSLLRTIVPTRREHYCLLPHNYLSIHNDGRTVQHIYRNFDNASNEWDGVSRAHREREINAMDKHM